MWGGAASADGMWHVTEPVRVVSLEGAASFAETSRKARGWRCVLPAGWGALDPVRISLGELGSRTKVLSPHCLSANSKSESEEKGCQELID